MEVIAITICLNYSHVLEHTIKQNSKFFKKWIIVTSISDTKTIQLLENFKDIIHVLIYNDFHINKSSLNKGGAIKFAQDYTDIHFKDSKILILDADIYLPDIFLEKLPMTLEPDTLYGVSERYDFWSVNDFMKNSNPHKYRLGDEFVGFFQLYKQNPIYKYQNSHNCSQCDNWFRDLFLKKQRLEISVKHLGKEGVNWNGIKKK